MTLLYTYLFGCWVVSVIGLIQLYYPLQLEYSNTPGHPITEYPKLTVVTVFIVFMLHAPFLAYILISDRRTQRYLEGLRLGFKQV